MKKRWLAVMGAALLPVLVAASTPLQHIQEMVQGVTTTTSTTLEVLVLNSAGTEIPALPNRAGIEIQNNGPNDIWCGLGSSAAVAVLTKSRRVAASGGTWSIVVGHRQGIWCRAATADQVTGAATTASQVLR